jgi:aminopeptidase
VGHSYPETGGRNESAIHVDLICGLHDGEIVVDGEVFYRNGDFAS